MQVEIWTGVKCRQRSRSWLPKTRLFRKKSKNDIDLEIINKRNELSKLKDQEKRLKQNIITLTNFTFQYKPLETPSKRKRFFSFPCGCK